MPLSRRWSIVSGHGLHNGDRAHLSQVVSDTFHPRSQASPSTSEIPESKPHSVHHKGLRLGGTTRHAMDVIICQ